MPLIKDKDRYKKLSARDRGRARIGETPDLPNKLTNITQREKQEATDKSKSEAILESQNNTHPVLSYHVSQINVVENIFKIPKGHSLINILLGSTETSGNTTLSIHWSYSKPEDLTFASVTLDGIIPTVTGGDTIHFHHSSAIGAGLSVSVFPLLISYSFLSSVFTNVPKDVYIYACSSKRTDITYATVEASA